MKSKSNIPVRCKQATPMDSTVTTIVESIDSILNLWETAKTTYKEGLVTVNGTKTILEKSKHELNEIAKRIEVLVRETNYDCPDQFIGNAIYLAIMTYYQNDNNAFHPIDFSNTTWKYCISNINPLAFDYVFEVLQKFKYALLANNAPLPSPSIRNRYFQQVLMYISARYHGSNVNNKEISNLNLIARTLRSDILANHKKYQETKLILDMVRTDVKDLKEQFANVSNKDISDELETFRDCVNADIGATKDIIITTTKSFTDRIDYMCKDMTSVYREMHSLKDRMDTLEERLSDERTNNKQLRKQLLDNDTANALAAQDLRKEISSLKANHANSINELRKEVQELKAASTKKPDGPRLIDQLRDDTKELNDRVSVLESELKEQRDINAGLVASIDRFKERITDNSPTVYIYDYEEMKQNRAALHAELRLYYKPFAKLLAIAYNTPVATIAK